jgi:glycosyltransferase involved in cell wall biosynthesis
MEGLINSIVLISHEGKVEEKLNGMGVKTLVHPFFYLWERPKPLKTAIHHPTRTALYRFLTLNNKCINETVSELKGIQVDIVHSNSSITTVGVGLAKQLGAKHLWHIREFLDLDFGVSVYGGRNRLRRLIDGADARICVSSAVAKHWQLTHSNTYVLWDTVDGNQTSNTFDLTKEPYFLFCSANITDRKGAITAVKAFCMSRLSSKGYRLKIIGHCEDDYKERLLALASDREEDLGIDFVDYTDNITDYFARATAFLMCSQCEALGRVTIQAMKNHCPVIAFYAGGTTDFVHQNETGLLFNTIEECADLMRDVVSRDFSGMTDNAYNLAIKCFSFESYRNKLYEIYRGLSTGENNNN